MITNLTTLLEDAKKRKYAVGMFTTTSITMAEAVIEAAEELNAPVIIGQAQLFEEFGPMDKYGPYYRKLAEEAKVPVCLHLDHGTSVNYIMRAIKCGYTSVMADFSELPFEDNVRMVKTVVDVCHPIGVSVEAMCGKMPNVAMVEADSDINLREFFTDPEELKRFIDLTVADAMTVSFGTIHGMKVQQPVLDLEHLKKLEAASDCALVMHGSSGVERSQLREAITLGLRKVNVYTAPAIRPQAVLTEAFKNAKEPFYIHEILDMSKRAITEAAKEYIVLLGNGNF